MDLKMRARLRQVRKRALLQVPLKYANHVTGASYIISFGVGSAIVTVAALAAVNLAHTLRHRYGPQTLHGKRLRSGI